jgi:hypothetical protein
MTDHPDCIHSRPPIATSAPKPNKTVFLPVALIAIGPRRRLDEAKVSELMESIRSIGLLKPIVVMRPEEVGCDTVRLVAGLHRLEVTKRIGLSMIQCIVLEFNDTLRIELADIDENFNAGSFDRGGTCDLDGPAQRDHAGARRADWNAVAICYSV